MLRNLFQFTFVFFLILCSSCKSLNAQEKETLKTKKRKISKPKFGDVVKDEKQFNQPNTFYIEAKVLSTVKQQTNCNGKEVNAIACKAFKIVSQGNSVVHFPNAKQTVYFNIPKNPKLQSLKIMKGKIVQLHIKEKLCKKGNESNYEVLSFTVK
ncbi:hypothetical protein [uncultured Tenacibaculum sp.]|uniref:hypothetical protein n=1 Tax=uncultured Tenacibaculum sp. TaxID=174713 RepID=UPI0026276D41|nr:hypothetical protein [uncultured Tenacibaculum sp.]